MSDDGEKKDLTKITDLSEFIHEEDPETDALLENSEDDEDITSKPVDEMASLDELDDDENTFKEASFDDQDEEDDDENDDNEPTFGERDPELSFGSDDDDSPSEESEGPLFGAQDSNFEETSFDSEDDEDNEDEAQDDAFGEQDDESLDEVSFGSEESFEEEDPEPEAEEAQTIPASIPPSKESFDDVRQFAKNISYGVVAAGGNPPYSLIMKNIKYKEDAEDIMIILREHGLVNDSSAAAMQQGLDNGSVLISQISEYSAIYLAHRMRRFDMEVLVGLSEELHSSKTYDSSAHGLVTKNTLKKNRKETMDLASKPVNLENILMATTPGLENYIIQKYIGIVTEHRVIDESELEVLQRANFDEEFNETIKEERKEFRFFERNEDELLADISLGLDEVYQELADALKTQCLKKNGNAVIGINFQLTPLVSRDSEQSHIKYKITATGNVVWVLGAGGPSLGI